MGKQEKTTWLIFCIGCLFCGLIFVVQGMNSSNIKAVIGGIDFNITNLQAVCIGVILLVLGGGGLWRFKNVRDKMKK